MNDSGKAFKRGERCLHICCSHKYNNLKSYKEKLYQILITHKCFEGQGAAGIQKAFICTKACQTPSGARRVRGLIDTCACSEKDFRIERKEALLSSVSFLGSSGQVKVPGGWGWRRRQSQLELHCWRGLAATESAEASSLLPSGIQRLTARFQTSPNLPRRMKALLAHLESAGTSQTSLLWRHHLWRS